MEKIEIAEKQQKVLESVQETIEKLCVALPDSRFSKEQVVAILNLFMSIYYA